MSNIKQSVAALSEGGVIAYPTEGVFGLGCDPDNQDAIEKLLAIKQRPIEKGLILIAANYQQLLSYIDESQLSVDQLSQIKRSWPGAVTWIMPCQPHLSNHLTGAFNSLAVRVSDHPIVQELCLALDKPITSTSANLTGEPSCMTTEEVAEQLGDKLDAIVMGKTSGRRKPSQIIDAMTGKVLREG
ncbi:threonylcarbamoyl-AMP synthase [Vibrio sp. SS-MA-C1-2]|uniref:L-threonylcarbamoyladenylate synthase n=1 Tax=Vibrio sp. SS-MA-C1-2 TaxID=2908646 RepID=UPI001F43C452|nr:L-threonylcarbamoyladenylate synthase [Vibrio sp. SS-MA-C1-2]UJF19362.1 threonylcarbamoyl-AMP synthase [Vibrio sp. SS-MA-C1-2]